MKTAQVKLQEHSQRAHALLSASGASRWLNCTPSAKLEEEFGEKKDSPFAAEGTLAHELAELFLRHDVLGTVTDEEFSDRFDKLSEDKFFNQEMLDMVDIYVRYCSDGLVEARAENILAIMEIEQKLDLTEFVPESFGTSDCVIINDDVMEVIDLKYGKGVPVYAEWNRQEMLYGLGALRKYDTMYDIKELRLTIVQPRLNNISTWVISVKDLLDWAVNELRPRALDAFEGKGELNSGDWCRFCAVKNRCRKLYEKQMELARYEFASADMLTDDEIADILRRAPQLVEWANSITAYAQEKAVDDNKEWPGFKLVEGRSARKWSDEDEALDMIYAKFPELSEDQVLTSKLKGITDIEKLVGKKRFSELSGVIVKPQGKPTLVPEEDKRPALGANQAKEDFKD